MSNIKEVYYRRMSNDIWDTLQETMKVSQVTAEDKAYFKGLQTAENIFSSIRCKYLSELSKIHDEAPIEGCVAIADVGMQKDAKVIIRYNMPGTDLWVVQRIKTNRLDIIDGSNIKHVFNSDTASEMISFEEPSEEEK